jgi:hypothetical protein
MNYIMKKYGSQKMNIILALLAVLVISVGYLVMQSGKEGLEPDMASAISMVTDAAVNEKKREEEEAAMAMEMPME